MSVSFIVGWVFLILSWVVPRFFKDKEEKGMWSVVLASMALGAFISSLLN